jgi:hypothetical protein
VEEHSHPGVKGWKLEVHSWLDLLTKKNWRRTVVAVATVFGLHALICSREVSEPGQAGQTFFGTAHECKPPPKPPGYR